MVHYIRYLRTPQVNDASKKSLEIYAVVAVTTDLGDSFLSQDLTLVARIVDVTNAEILNSSEVLWKIGSRAAKVILNCNARYVGRLTTMHVTTRSTISAHDSCQVPAILDIWSSPFSIKVKAKAEPLVERRLQLQGKSSVRIWEETGDSIARHIWDASLGCLSYLNSCFEILKDQSLPSLRKLLIDEKSKRLRVLEMGAGCGIVGIALSQLRKSEVLLTDLEDAQDIMQTNIDCATPALGSSLNRQVLGWGLGLDGLKNANLDLVLVSDCIYNPDSSVLLVETLKEICKHNPNILIFVAFKRRHDADDIFFDAMRKNDMQITEQTCIRLPHIMTDHDTLQPQVEAFIYQTKK